MLKVDYSAQDYTQTITQERNVMIRQSICAALSIAAYTLLSSGAAWSASPTCTKTSVPRVYLGAPKTGQKYWAAHRGIFRFTPLVGYEPGDLSLTYKDITRSVPENSLTAVIAACASGFPAVEIDIRPGSDNTWVMHEPTLDRMVSYKINDVRGGSLQEAEREVDPALRSSTNYFFLDDAEVYQNVASGGLERTRTATRLPMALTSIPRHKVLGSGNENNRLTLRNYVFYNYAGHSERPVNFTVSDEPKFTNFFTYLKNDSRFDNMWFILDSDYNTLYNKIGEAGSNTGEGKILNGMRVVYKFYTSQMAVNSSKKLAQTTYYKYGPRVVLMLSDQDIKYTGVGRIKFKGADGEPSYLTLDEMDGVIKQIQNAGGDVIGVEATKTGRLTGTSKQTRFIDTVATHYDGIKIGEAMVYRWGSYRTRDLQRNECNSYPENTRANCTVWPDGNYTYWTEMYSYPQDSEDFRNNFALKAQVITGDLK